MSNCNNKDREKKDNRNDKEYEKDKEHEEQGEHDEQDEQDKQCEQGEDDIVRGKQEKKSTKERDQAEKAGEGKRHSTRSK
jgi:hypothetical protein